MVWAGIAALWAVVALWMLAERAVATGWAYRALSGYAEHRAARHGHALPELDDGTLVTHAAVLQLLDPAVAAMFAPVRLTPMGDRGITARWYIRADGELFPTVTCVHGGGEHRHRWPDGTATAGSCPAWVSGTTAAAALIELANRGARRPTPTPASVPTQVSTDELQGWAAPLREYGTAGTRSPLARPARPSPTHGVRW